MTFFEKSARLLPLIAIAALPLGWSRLLPPAIAHGDKPKPQQRGYEIWGADQSNSVAGIAAPGTKGSWLWIWDSQDMEKQLRTGKPAQPIGCDGKNQPGTGPCNLLDVFPVDLVEYDATGATGQTLMQLPGFGRLHGMLTDPQNRYMNVNIFAPNGGYVGIIDGETKAAVALFRVSGTSVGRSVHMSFWNADGSALLVANLNGKILERIDVQRDSTGKITGAIFNKAASLGVGTDLTITDQPKVYRGNNAQGQPMLGRISGEYSAQALGNATPAGFCKENGCTNAKAPLQGGRPNNLIICPITSQTDKVYITFGGGGLLVADSRKTPMQIIGEYDNQVINGAGCGGVEVRHQMWLNAGVSASPAGASQSTFTIYTLNDRGFRLGSRPNTPAPRLIFKDPSNTNTGGNMAGTTTTNGTEQKPGVTTRRDSHGMARTLSGQYIHTVDRLQNNVEVFNRFSLARTTYDLTSANGQGQGEGACARAAVTDDEQLLQFRNDPAPDLMDTTPDGKYIVIALRGPVPVSVNHSAQGSCPGVGIVKLTQGGALGKLVGVLRSTNTVDTSIGSAPGGVLYKGAERSDVHGVAVRRKLSTPKSSGKPAKPQSHRR